MPTKTYKPIATTTLGSAAASYTFSSIPSTYTDIVLIFGGSMSNFGNLRIQFNSDTGNNYSFTRLLGDGSGAQSDRGSTQPAISIAILDANVIGNSVTNIQNYANTTTYKTAIARGNSTGTYLGESVGLWRSTAAISSITIYPSAGNLNSGSVITIYGIL